VGQRILSLNRIFFLISEDRSRTLFASATFLGMGQRLRFCFFFDSVVLTTLLSTLLYAHESFFIFFYTSNSHEFELHRPSNKGTKLLLKVIKAIIIIITSLVLPVTTLFRALCTVTCAHAKEVPIQCAGPLESFFYFFVSSLCPDNSLENFLYHDARACKRGSNSIRRTSFFLF